METQKKHTDDNQTYLTFKLNKELYAIDAFRVFEISEVKEITEIPGAPAYMKGVMNLRGDAIPVIDIKLKFGLHAINIEKETCIVVLHVEIEGEPLQLGVMVDSVEEVLEIKKSQILPPPSIGSKYKSKYIDGIANVGEKFIMQLNIDNVFTFDELLNIKDISAENAINEETPEKEEKE